MQRLILYLSIAEFLHTLFYAWVSRSEPSTYSDSPCRWLECLVWVANKLTPSFWAFAVLELIVEAECSASVPILELIRATGLKNTLWQSRIDFCMQVNREFELL